MVSVVVSMVSALKYNTTILVCFVTEVCLSIDSVDEAERDAALTMCMISGGSECSSTDLLHAVNHDHCYTKCPFLPPSSPSPFEQVTVKLRTSGRRGTRSTG